MPHLFPRVAPSRNISAAVALHRSIFSIKPENTSDSPSFGTNQVITNSKDNDFKVVGAPLQFWDDVSESTSISVKVFWIMLVTKHPG